MFKYDDQFWGTPNFKSRLSSCILNMGNSGFSACNIDILVLLLDIIRELSDLIPKRRARNKYQNV